MDLAALLGYFFFKLLVPFLFLLSALTFLWGLFLHFVAGSADEELSEEGKILILYGLAMLVIMMLVWWLLSSIPGL